MIKLLCGMNACRHELEQITGGGFQSRRPPRGHAVGFPSSNYIPPKMMRGNGGYRGPIGGGAYGNRGGYRRGYNNRGYGMGGANQGGYRNDGGSGGFHGHY